MSRKKIIPLVLFCVLVTGFFFYFFIQKDTEINPVIPSSTHTENPTSALDGEPTLPTPPPIPIKALTYSAFTLSSVSPMKELIDTVGEANIDTVLRINRIDSSNLRSGATLSIPSDMSDYEALSPFPNSLPILVHVPKIILVSQEIQAFAVYEYGARVRWGPTSTGKASTPTPNGLHFANWKGKEVISTSNDEWILKWNVNIHNTLGVSLHQYALPGYPASHSCVRLLEADAKWIYDWVDQWNLAPGEREVLSKGTPVVLFGTYEYEGTPPWKALTVNANATTIEMTEIETVLDSYRKELLLETQQE